MTTCHVTDPQILANCLLEHDSKHMTASIQMASTLTRSQYNHRPLGCGGTGCNPTRATNKSATTMMLSCQYGPQSLRIFSSTVLNLCQKEIKPKVMCRLVWKTFRSYSRKKRAWCSHESGYWLLTLSNLRLFPKLPEKPPINPKPNSDSLLNPELNLRSFFSDTRSWTPPLLS